MIKKLAFSWNDFKIYLKYMHREMKIKDLVLRLRVEEDHRKKDKVDRHIYEARTHIVENKRGQLEARKVF